MTTINRTGTILIVGLMIFVVTKRYLEGIKLNKEYNLTVAVVCGISHPAEGGPIAEFEYCVNHHTYKNGSSFNTNDYKIKTGDKFLLKYYPANPKIARIQLDDPLDSSQILKQGLSECGKERNEP